MAQPNRRKFARYATENSIAIHSGDSVTHGELLDKSLGGIGVTTESVDGLAFGQEVQIANLEDQPVTGYIRAIRRDADSFVINVSWDDFTHDSGQRYKRVAHFVAFQEILFVCDVLFNDVGPYQNVRLWDGATFRLSTDDVRERTMDARRAELVEQDNLDRISSVYNLSTSGKQDAVEKILDFEFTLDVPSPQVTPQVQS